MRDSMTHSTFATRPALTVDVALAPMLLRREPERLRRTVAIVVDVVRATTSLCVMFERGCRRVDVAGDIPTARQAAQRIRAALPAGELPPLLAGEAGGLAPAGFDRGNSPAEFAPLDLEGRTVIFATTNGTRALHACAGMAATLVGAFRNATPVAQAAVALARGLAGPASDQDLSIPREGDVEGAPDAPTVMVVCAGRNQYPAYDDTVCAGYLAACVQREAEAAGCAATLANGAQIAIAASQTALRDGVLEALAESEAGRAIAALGLGADLDWCAACDVCAYVPIVAPDGPAGDLLAVRLWIPD